MSNLWLVTFISVLVVAAVVYFVIRKIEKDNKARHNAKTSKPTSSIDKSEIDMNGLYLNKIEIVSKKKFLGELLKTKGGNGIETYHS